MFRPAKMQKLSIVTLNEYAKPIVDALHEKGYVQIDDLSELIQEEEEYEGLDVSKQDPVASRIASLSMKCNSIIDTLKSACHRFPLKGAILHSERGSQYTSESFRNTVKKCFQLQRKRGL